MTKLKVCLSPFLDVLSIALSHPVIDVFAKVGLVESRPFGINLRAGFRKRFFRPVLVPHVGMGWKVSFAQPRKIDGPCSGQKKSR
jgi:hypothetical protein